jgi:hypothetical protein
MTWAILLISLATGSVEQTTVMGTDRTGCIENAPRLAIEWNKNHEPGRAVKGECITRK